MYKINEFLLNLGLSGKEVRVYLKLLELGAQPVTVVAKKLKLPRSSVAFCLNVLVQKKFVKIEIGSKSNYFYAVTPQEIKQLLKKKSDDLSSKMEELDCLLPEFQNLIKNFVPHSNVKFFEGVEGICRMIDLLLEEDVPVHFISAHKFHPAISDYIRDVWVSKRKKMKTKCQMILSAHKDAKDYVGVAKGVYEWVAFFMQEDPKNELGISIAIYGNKVQFLSCQEDDLTGVLIENEYLANTFMVIFKMLKSTSKIDVIDRD